MSKAYYNENNPKAAAWLRELEARGLIAPGDVDERDIRDVKPAELMGYTQCHFFAGIGVWSHALRRAGWADDRPVWTGSCPCQPFSAAGRKRGTADERHLWPHWFHLIRVCKPRVVFGEQVASKDGITWFDTVSSDMEGEGYTCGTVVFPACGVGAPHKRERLYFVADANRERQQGIGVHVRPRGSLEDSTETSGGGKVVLLEYAARDGRKSRGSKSVGGIFTGGCSEGPVGGFWRNAEWVYCRDGKYRAVEPGSFPLANGAPQRVGRLCGYGNAIVTEAAVEFISAYQEVNYRNYA